MNAYINEIWIYGTKVTKQIVIILLVASVT